MKVQGFYVYILYDWQGIPRYVGSGGGARWNTSRYHGDGNSAKIAFLKETREKIGKIPSKIIKDGLTQKEAFQLEIEVIKKIGKYPSGPLTNIADGGPGNSGAVKSAEWRAKISATLTGHIQSEETRAKKAAAARGKKHTDETKAKQSAAHKGKKFSPEHLANLRAAVARRPSQKGIQLSDEARANQSAGQKQAWANDPRPRIKGKVPIKDTKV